MKTRFLLFSFLILFVTVNLCGQNQKIKMFYNLGFSESVFGSGDIWCTGISNEFEVYFNNFLSSSASLVVGKKNGSSEIETFSFVQSNLNLFVSPFGNQRLLNFRLGIGGNYLNGDGQRLVSFTNKEYRYTNFNVIGANFVADLSLRLSQRFKISSGLFIKPYVGGNINSGIFLKVGYNI